MAEQNRETRKMAVYIPKGFKADFHMSGLQAFMIGFVTVDDAARVRGISGIDDELFMSFDNLTFRCQVGGSTNDGKPYGYSLEYKDVYSVGLREAERMVKMLRRIDKASESFPVHPETFGQYVSLMCAALKVNMVVQEPADSGRSHDDTMYTLWKLKDCQWLVDRRIAEFMEQHSEAMARAKSW